MLREPSILSEVHVVRSLSWTLCLMKLVIANSYWHIRMTSQSDNSERTSVSPSGDGFKRHLYLSIARVLLA